MRKVDDPRRRFLLPALAVLGAAVYGTVGYVLIEGWGLLDAFYMTVTTMTTVGFGEIHPLSQAGRLFGITLILGGAGTMFYTFGVFAETLAEGRFASFRRDRRMTRDISGLRDHFIICGYGRIGTQIAKELDRQKVAHVVIELNPGPLAQLRSEERLCIEADAASEDALRAAGIERAKGLMAAVDSDERVVYITLAARALSPNLFITARAGHPESIRRLELAGANRVVSPYRMAGRLMAELALRPVVVDVIETMRHGGAEIGIEEIILSASCHARGRSLTDSGLLKKGQARLLAVRRRDGTLYVNPAADLRLEEGDLVVAMGTEPELTLTATALQ